MEEEALLKRQFAGDNPFKVPEGYFNDFQQKLLSGISSTKAVRKPLLRQLRPWLWTAVSAAAVVSGLVFYVSKPADNSNQAVSGTATVATPQTDATDYIMEEVSDYAMIDNSDLYSYVADE